MIALKFLKLRSIIHKSLSKTYYQAKRIKTLIEIYLAKARSLLDLNFQTNQETKNNSTIPSKKVTKINLLQWVLNLLINTWLNRTIVIILNMNLGYQTNKII